MLTLTACGPQEPAKPQSDEDVLKVCLVLSGGLGIDLFMTHLMKVLNVQRRVRDRRQSIRM